MTIGFIKIHRQILDWNRYSDNNTFRLFMHLLLTANYEDKVWRGIEVNRGQLATSNQSLATSTNLSQQQIRTALRNLKATGEITIQTTNRYTLVNIENYNLYQDNPNKDNMQSNISLNNPTTNKEQTNNNQITTTKEIKKIRSKEDKNICRYFSEKDLAEGLRFILENKLNRKLKTKGWSSHIKKLRDIDLKGREEPEVDIGNAIQAISDYHGEEFFPEINSARSLRDKFDKIENFLNRSKKASTPKQPSNNNEVYQEFLKNGGEND